MKRPRVAVDASAAALAALLVLGAWALARVSRSLTFSGDDLSFFAGRRGHSIGVFLTPHNEHLSAAPVFAFKALLALFGARHYWPFLATALGLHLLTVALVYVFARERIGAWAALVPAAILIVLGSAWQDLLWAFQMGYFGSTAAAVSAFLALERRTRRADLLACVLLTVSLLWSSVGIGALAGAIVELALLRRAGWTRRLWVVAVPTALYAVWYVAYGASASTATLSNLAQVPRYVADSLAAATAVVTGLARAPSGLSVDIAWGRPLAVAVVVLLVLHVRRGRSLSPRFWALATMALTLWAAARLSYGPGRDAVESRYAYVNALLVLLAAVELARGWRPNPRTGAALAAGTCVVLISNIGVLVDSARTWRAINQVGAAGLAAVEIARDLVPPEFAPVTLTPLVAGPYLSAVDAFGSPAPSPARLATFPEVAREEADGVLAQAEQLSLQPVARPPRAAGCRVVTLSGGAVELMRGPGTLTLGAGPAPATVRLRRFATSYAQVSLALAPGQTASLGLPRDRAPQPWHVRIESSRPQLTLCG